MTEYSLEIKGEDLCLIDNIGPNTLARLPLMELAKALHPIMNNLCGSCHEPHGAHAPDCAYLRQMKDQDRT